MDLCFLSEWFCWHAILPDPARPLRRAPRLDLPVVCLGFGFERSLQGGHCFTNPATETRNMNAKPRRMQPQDSENAEQGTC